MNFSKWICPVQVFLEDLRNFQLYKTKNVTAMFRKPTSGSSLRTVESCSHLHVLRSILILPSHLHQIFYCKYSNIYCGIKMATAPKICNTYWNMILLLMWLWHWCTVDNDSKDLCTWNSTTWACLNPYPTTFPYGNAIVSNVRKA